MENLIIGHKGIVSLFRNNSNIESVFFYYSENNFDLDIKFKDGFLFSLKMSKEEIINKRDSAPGFNIHSLLVWEKYFNEKAKILMLRIALNDNKVSSYFFQNI